MRFRKHLAITEKSLQQQQNDTHAIQTHVSGVFQMLGEQNQAIDDILSKFIFLLEQGNLEAEAFLIAKRGMYSQTWQVHYMDALLLNYRGKKQSALPEYNVGAA